jgi:hypothetical protein
MNEAQCRSFIFWPSFIRTILLFKKLNNHKEEKPRVGKFYHWRIIFLIYIKLPNVLNIFVDKRKKISHQFKRGNKDEDGKIFNYWLSNLMQCLSFPFIWLNICFNVWSSV